MAIHSGSDRGRSNEGDDESEIVNIDEDYDDDDDNDIRLNDLVTSDADMKFKSYKKQDVEKELSSVEDQPRKQGREHYEWPIKEEMRNIELEKELEERIRSREGCIKQKDRMYRYSEKVNKHKSETNRKRTDEYHEDGNRGYKHKEDRYRDDAERDLWHKTGRDRDNIDRKKRSREYASDFESKNYKDGSHRHTKNPGESLIYDDWDARRKDNKYIKRDNSNNNKDEVSDYRSRSLQDQHPDSKRYMNDAKIDRNFEREMSRLRNDDIEPKHSYQRSSSNCKHYPSRDRHRVLKQKETKYTNRYISDKVGYDDISATKRLKSASQMSSSSTNKFSSHQLPQPLFKAGSDSLLESGSAEAQTNWNNFSYWPPYMPFHQAPPPMFNPFMYQPMPPMYTSHATMPYHFTGDGFGRWDHGSVGLQSVVQKNEDSVHGHKHEHIENEENNLDFNNTEVKKVTDSSHVSVVEKDDDTFISRVYLSKIDVSKELTRPELYDQCTSMLLDSDQGSVASDESDCKILYIEEGVEDDISNSASLFAAADDSVFEKAMSLYAKQKEHVTFRSVEDQEKENTEMGHPVENQEKERCVTSVGDCEVKVNGEVICSCNNYDGSMEVDKFVPSN